MLILLFLFIFLFLIGVFLYGKKKYGFIKNQTSERIVRLLYPASMTLIKILPERVFGSEKLLKDKYLELYGEKDYIRKLKFDKIRTAAYLYFILIVFCMLLMIAVYKEQLNDSEIAEIRRPLWEEGDKFYEIQAFMRYKDNEYVEDRIIRVRSKELSEEEIGQKFNKTIDRIPSAIIGENADLQHVYKSLDLFSKDYDTFVNIKWNSNTPSLVDEKGNVYSNDIEAAQDIVLYAELELQDKTKIFPVELTIVPFKTQASPQEIIKVGINKVTEVLSRENEGEFLRLPNTYEDISIQWMTERTQYVKTVMIIMISVLLILFYGKHSKINKNIKIKRMEIEKDFPEFICKLILLINAGLIVQSALEKIAMDYQEHCRGKTQRALYEELTAVIRNVEESGTSLIYELKNFANRCRVKEIMRFVSIVSENIHSGSTLSEKLQSEADLVWNNRKSRAEEMGRLAETKLAFPLVILLMVLIAIIITPVLMEM